MFCAVLQLPVPSPIFSRDLTRRVKDRALNDGLYSPGRYAANFGIQVKKLQEDL
jgi:hypothetical protein